MSVARRREMIDPQHPGLPIGRQCALVGISGSASYAPTKGETALVILPRNSGQGQAEMRSMSVGER